MLAAASASATVVASTAFAVLIAAIFVRNAVTCVPIVVSGGLGVGKEIEAAEAEARKNNWNMAIAILDAGSHLMMFQRMYDVQIGSIDIAIGKAKTSVNFKRPTKALDDLVSGGRDAFLAIDGVIPLQGGLPVMVDGKLIGGVGVSGGTAPQDEQVAQAAVSVLQG